MVLDPSSLGGAAWWRCTCLADPLPIPPLYGIVPRDEEGGRGSQPRPGFLYPQWYGVQSAVISLTLMQSGTPLGGKEGVIEGMCSSPASKVRAPLPPKQREAVQHERHPSTTTTSVSQSPQAWDWCPPPKHRYPQGLFWSCLCLQPPCQKRPS